MLTTEAFFDLSSCCFRECFAPGEPVWETLKQLKSYMNDCTITNLSDALPQQTPLPDTLIVHQGELINDPKNIRLKLQDPTKGKMQVFHRGEILPGASVLMAGVVFDTDRIALGEGVFIESGAVIKGVTILGDRTEVRQGAYLRGYCLVGKRCVIGHVTEVKHSVFLDDAKAGHFAYLGDSLLGNDVNMGAGTKLANLRFTNGDVPIRTESGIMQSGLRKLGAILGDNTQTGCNSVTNPGTLLGKKSMLLPNTTAPSGYHKPGSLIR